MPVIIRQTEHTRQPRIRTPLKPRYARHLRFLSCPGVPGFLFEGATRVTAPNAPASSNTLFTGNSRVSGPSGMGALTESGGVTTLKFDRTDFTTGCVVEIPSASDWTTIVQVDGMSTSGSNPGFWRVGSDGSGTTFFIFRDATGLWIRQNATDFFSGGGIPATGSNITAVGSVRSSQRALACLNGVTHFNSTTSVPATADLTGTNGITKFGVQGSTGTETQVYGKYNLIAILGMALEVEEARELSINPWQIFEPTRRRIWVPNVTVAASFKSAYARNSNTVISGGGVY